MAKIWGAMHCWEAWQLRILVLGSLGVQWFLLFAAPMRKYTIPRWFRTFIWLAYIGSDALAIYALATLFNRHASSSSTSSSCGNADWSKALEVLWAPVLLIHLGGQEEITAYNIEDNELWTRHTVTLVSQVAVAVYAFCKSWRSSGDRRLLASAILLFVVGILSFSEKPWALRRASINRLAAVSSRLHGRDRKPHRRRWGLFTKLEDKYIGWTRAAAHFYYWTATDKDSHHHQAADHHQVILPDADKVHMILSDMSLFAASSDLAKRELMKQDSIRAAETRRQREQGIMTVQVEVDAGEGEEEEEEDQLQAAEQRQQVLGLLSPSAEMGSQRWLRNAFGLIYTRVNVATTPAYLASTSCSSRRSTSPPSRSSRRAASAGTTPPTSPSRTSSSSSPPPSTCSPSPSASCSTRPCPRPACRRCARHSPSTTSSARLAGGCTRPPAGCSSAPPASAWRRSISCAGARTSTGGWRGS
ncbi:hypothetical protein PVAP13_4KG005100 [Panicum virgatum]|uniref:DUF4220 domain-containing protein n=1 Tax=Panicum virgatum TaxID=38727 RepID=A0A8T0TJL2_PANVG|nr:hypothetical protein PVAP13_4KG005100 [Panicum virgatum]